MQIALMVRMEPLLCALCKAGLLPGHRLDGSLPGAPSSPGILPSPASAMLSAAAISGAVSANQELHADRHEAAARRSWATVHARAVESPAAHSMMDEQSLGEQPGPKGMPYAIARAQRAVVAVEAGGSWASGVAVGRPGFIITNAHVLGPPAAQSEARLHPVPRGPQMSQHKLRAGTQPAGKKPEDHIIPPRSVPYSHAEDSKTAPAELEPAYRRVDSLQRQCCVDLSIGTPPCIARHGWPEHGSQQQAAECMQSELPMPSMPCSPVHCRPLSLQRQCCNPVVTPVSCNPMHQSGSDARQQLQAQEQKTAQQCSCSTRVSIPGTACPAAIHPLACPKQHGTLHRSDSPLNTMCTRCVTSRLCGTVPLMPADTACHSRLSWQNKLSGVGRPYSHLPADLCCCRGSCAGQSSPPVHHSTRQSAHQLPFGCSCSSQEPSSEPVSPAEASMTPAQEPAGSQCQSCTPVESTCDAAGCGDGARSSLSRRRGEHCCASGRQVPGCSCRNAAAVSCSETKGSGGRAACHAAGSDRRSLGAVCQSPASHGPAALPGLPGISTFDGFARHDLESCSCQEGAACCAPAVQDNQGPSEDLNRPYTRCCSDGPDSQDHLSLATLPQGTCWEAPQHRYPCAGSGPPFSPCKGPTRHAAAICAAAYEHPQPAVAALCKCRHAALSPEGASSAAVTGCRCCHQLPASDQLHGRNLPGACPAAAAATQCCCRGRIPLSCCQPDHTPATSGRHLGNASDVDDLRSSHTAEPPVLPDESRGDGQVADQQPYTDEHGWPAVWVRVPVWQTSLHQQGCQDRGSLQTHSWPAAGSDDHLAGSYQADQRRTTASPSLLPSSSFSPDPSQAPSFSSSLSPRQFYHKLLGYQRMRARVLKVFSGHLDLALLQLVPCSASPVPPTGGPLVHSGSLLREGMSKS